jgi:carbon-monoxide dehydrogenase large subunit
MLRRIFGLPASKVRVIGAYIGGAFGRFPKIEQIAALLALHTRRRVRMTLSREEVFTSTSHKCPIVVSVKDGVLADGTLLARHMRLVLDGGAYAELIPRMTRTAAYGSVGCYRIENFSLDSYGVYTNNPVTETWRGVGVSQVAFATESQMDIIAQRLGIDAVELRLRNLLRAGERNVLGEPLRDFGAEPCLRKVASVMGTRSAPMPAGPWKDAWGIALIAKFSSAESTNAATIRVSSDGAIEVRHSSDEVGQGVDTVLAQIAAEEFATQLSSVTIVRGDTAITPYDVGASSSRSTFNTGNAVRLACQDAKMQIAKLAAPLLGCDAGELIVSGGQVFVGAEPARCLQLGRLLAPPARGAGGHVLGQATWHREAGPIDPETGQGERINAYYTHGAQALRIAVHPGTGEVRVLEAFSCFDVGQPINPKMCEQQIEGGLVMALGSALSEEIVMKNGRVQNPSFGPYRMLTASDVPRMGHVHSWLLDQSEQPEGPFGAKGMGEAVVCAAAPALGNALANALGLRFVRLPITAERVLHALRDAHRVPA